MQGLNQGSRAGHEAQEHLIRIVNILYFLQPAFSSYSSTSPTVVLGPPSAQALSNLLKMQIIRPYSKTTKSEALGMRPSKLMQTND